MAFETYAGKTLVQMKIHANEQRAEIERLRSFIREVVAIDPLAGGGDARYFVTADFVARARALTV